jgi:cyclic pyranopterin phosphate synthase
MLDKFGREIDYLRISVTRNCNLNCIYCVPDKVETPEANCNTFLSAVDIGTVTAAMAKLGIKKVRLTGGEPLLRPDLEKIIGNIANISGITEIAMTTNGIGLAERAGQLKSAGLKRVNISIDSLENDKFARITGGGNLARVLKGIHSVVRAGLTPVHLNMVVMKGINDNEIDRFIELTRDNPVNVRFIELMPIGDFGKNYTDHVVFNRNIIAARPELQAVNDDGGKQPARYYRIGGYCGQIGFISPLSHKFCVSCNRIRLTCEGTLKPCLGDNREIDLAPVLRREPEKLEWYIQKAIFRKPASHHFEQSFVSKRNMAAIGG